jgi:fructuronate reductase
MPSVPRLSESTLARRRPGVAAPDYDRARVSPGIVHFGPGAFARAHIASYVERLLAKDPRWGIAGIALRHGALAADLREQDHLYALAELEAEPRFRVLGALKDYVAAPAEPERALARLTDPGARLITITVTEKGYCLDGRGELDLAHPDIVRDLAEPHAPRSLVGWLVLALRARRTRRLAPPVVLSCDNLASNGAKLRRAATAFAEGSGDTALARFIEAEVRFPSTMVDSITPATDAALIARVAEAIGLEDRAPVQREGFTQWVIEDVLGPDMPDLAAAGAELTSDVHAYEQAKLRLLNGTHSALAYIGLLRGRTTVGEAMADAKLAAFVARTMREDMAATLTPARGLDIPAYYASLLARMRNPAIAHKLIQIAQDGSQKLTYRYVEPIADLLSVGRPVARLCVPLAAWMRFVVDATRKGEALDDSLAGALATAAAGATGDAAHDVPRFLALREIFPAAVAANAEVRTGIEAAYADVDAALGRE